MRERIELLYTHDSDIFLVVLTALFQQIVINLTRAQDNTLHRFRVEVIDFTDGRQEGAVRQFVQAGDRQRMAQQRFRRHHHQRTTHTAQRLTTQHVVNLSRSRWHTNLHILFSTQLQIAFQTRGGVLRALAFVAVRQQHDQATHPAPLLLAGADELIDHHLSAVSKVTKLRFPDSQGARFRSGVAVFERQHRFFRKHGVPDFEMLLAVMHMLQRRVGRTVHLVMNHGMAVEERTATGVFTGQANRNPFINQRGVSQVFRRPPVEQLLAGGHRLAIAINLRHARLHFNAVRHSADAFSQLLQTFHLDFTRVALIPLVVEVR